MNWETIIKLGSPGAMGIVLTTIVVLWAYDGEGSVRPGSVALIFIGTTAVCYILVSGYKFFFRRSDGNGS